MRIAFYAPMKSPDDPVLSGDRQIARNLIRALELAGHEVRLASSFRSYDRGDPDRQRRLKRLGAEVARRTVRHFGGWRPDLWFTYHLYHKAPDHLGPRITEALGIPYVIAEASVANKRREGPFSSGFASAEAAISRADLAFGLNPADAAGLLPILKPDAIYRDLPAFLDTRLYRADAARRAEARKALSERFCFELDGTPILLAVAMMRNDQKLTSYEGLGSALARVSERFRLIVVGDGPARDAVGAHFSAVGLGPNVFFAGAVATKAIAVFYHGADLMVWPAIKEALGMSLVEAGAAGLPVVAGRSGGIASIIEDGVTGILTQEGDIDAFAHAVGHLLRNPSVRGEMGRAAAERIAVRHDISTAARHLDDGLCDMIAARQAAAGASR